MYNKTALILILSILASCGGPDMIRKNGLAYVEIGDLMPESDLKEWNGYPHRDTLLSGESFQWRASILNYPEGRVVLEEDFEGNRRINRIRIESKQHYLRGNIRIGMSFGEVKRRKKKLDAFYIAEYGLLDVVSARQPSIHYLIEDTQLSQVLSETQSVAVDRIQEVAKIVAIVVM